ncbi:DUF6105 family protein [Oryzifoliimicrobium ureilyticus]|uniref:DUF6105 family protein n=1 Tax=Oryzifoliimicrobium ureilyticus TaxID=3113724 RepID=UPI00307630C7
MKWFLIFWAGPIIFLGSWYWLSYYDMSFGIFMFSRQVHDLTFDLYGKMLGLPPADIPALVARAIVVDSLIVFSLLAFRRRAKILAWWRTRQVSKVDDRERAASLSKAP